MKFPETHPLMKASAILQRLGRAGRYVWETQKHMASWSRDPEKNWSLERRTAYVMEAIAWLRAKAVSPQRSQYRDLPVDFETFVNCPSLLNAAGVLWPGVMDEGKDINSGKYVECVMTGAIGVAKSTLALYTQAYQTYVLSCMINPHEVFGLDPASEILIVFQSINKDLAKDVDYQRLRNMLDRSPYFATEFPYDTGRASDIRFIKMTLIIKPVAGHDTAAIGQNVIGGIIDELNFMAVVENSKQTKDGGVYDQAMKNYNTIAMRRESRFMQLGELPGMLCLVSSRNYPGQFTDLKEAEAKTNPRIKVYDKKLWEVNPARYMFFTGQRNEEKYGKNHPFWFKVFIGTSTRRPRILDEKEAVDKKEAASGLVIEVPIEHKVRFENDILGALRDIAGVATLALHPFMVNAEAVAACFGKVPSILSRPECDFQDSKIEIYPKRFRNKAEPRFIHLDLAVTGDSCGFACGYVKGFTKIDRGDVKETLPIIEFDCLLEIRPPRGGEINFEKVRKLIYALRSGGLNIKWVSLDTYQSTDSRQILSQQGFIVGVQSVDVTTTPYDFTKQAFYDGRIHAPEHEKAQRELVTLEYNVKDQKIDHTPNGSKDIADAIAGVVYGLTMRREIWVKHNLSTRDIPASLKENSDATETRSIGYREVLREQRRDRK